MLIDWKELPEEGPVGQTVSPQNPLVMGATPWETCVNTLRHHLAPGTWKDSMGYDRPLTPYRDLGGTQPARWNVPGNTMPQVLGGDLSKAMRFWLSQEANSDETLSLTGYGTLAASEVLFQQGGYITLQPHVLPHRRHHYASDKSFWGAMRGPKTSIEAANCTAKNSSEDLVAVFQMAYIDLPAVAALITQRRVQGVVTLELDGFTSPSKDRRGISREPQTALRNAVCDSIKHPLPEWLAAGAVTEKTPLLWTMDELVELVIVLLPIANRLDPKLARDMAQLMAVYAAWSAGPDAKLFNEHARLYARTVELAWTWMLHQRIAALMCTEPAKKLLPWAVRAAQVRLNLLDKPAKEQAKGPPTLVLPYRFS
jgi:hypothetical protein